MPQLKDAVSSFKISPELQHQESYITTILKWMQDNPEQCKNTNYARMARTMTLGGVTRQKEKNIIFTLQNMNSRGLIDYSGAPRGRRKTFFINYLHKNIPREIINRAPSNDIKRHEELAGKSLIGVKHSIDQETQTETEAPTVESPVVEQPTSEPKTVEDVAVPTVPTMDVPIELDKMPNGNFTLQLNINFTINSKR